MDGKAFPSAVTVFLVVGLCFQGSHARAGCEAPAGRFVSLEGSVDVQRTAAATWETAALGIPLCEGDSIRVGTRSRAAIQLTNRAVLRLDQNTTMRLVDVTEDEQERSWLELLKGAIQSFSRKPRLLTINTPYLNGSIEGTEFYVRVADDGAELGVMEGTVVAENSQGTVSVTPGHAATALAGRSPVLRTVVRPRDAVQWSLYYPPLFSELAGGVEQVPAEVPGPLRDAVSLASQGKTTAAFSALDAVPQADRGADYYAYRASLLLSVGQVDEALEDIDKALAEDPRSGRAYALRSIIEVVQNDGARALEDAEHAVKLDPSGASFIALSYAQQAQFRIEEARDTLLGAVAQHPGDALAWARLAEVWLMLGDRKESREAAQKATSLAPELARTRLVLGYAALAEFHGKDATTAFEQAIALDPSDPLSHLGLGLSRIYGGDLDSGTQEVEVAVGLDSESALLRAYLGKSYFEQKRYPLDGQQYGIAKQLDPKDPTAYLYDGILKQTINRPVEAVKDLEKSIELNDNRAVYRSRLLLDKDRAARGTSLARAYRDLGFTQLGINQSTESLDVNPANASAHRFLSDTYQGLPGFESARVSELLQAQLMQDININPIQPSISSTNLNIATLGGPATPGFNEFTPLFEQNQVQLNLTGAVGNNDTYSGEGVLSGIYDRLSLSAGAFYYDTDGFRANNDLQHKIYNIYAQAAITTSFNVQVEFQRRDTSQGDLALNFDPESFSENLRRSLTGDTTRVGARYSPDEHSSFIFSYIYNNLDLSNQDKFAVGEIPGLGSIDFSLDATSRDKGNLYEGIYLYEAAAFNITAGVGFSDVDKKDTINASLDTPFGPQPLPTEKFDTDIKDYRGYIYGNLQLPTTVTWTLGLSYTNHQEEAFDLDRLLPKVGVQWAITDSLRLRGAYFETVKPVLAANRTLEPTQIAGFNQLFDDTDATQSTLYGGALDWQATMDVSLGAEFTRREFQSPELLVDGGAEFVDRGEWLYRGYAYWTPTNRWALNAQAIYDKYENDGTSFGDDIIPKNVTTLSFPVKALYFHPKGYFGGLGVTYVDQEVRRTATSTLPQGDSNFAVVDLSVGYRFPRRLGIASLSVQNLFDTSFDYMDDSFRRFGLEPVASPYTPDRTILGRVTLSF